MKFNVSHVRAHLECPTKAYNEHVLRRVPLGRPVALDVGGCWHLAMEGYLKNKSKETGLMAVRDYLISIVDEPNYPKVATGWGAIAPAYWAWKWPDEWELLEVEKLVEFKFGSPYELIIQGRLDGLVKWAGQYWHLQHKTLNPSTPLSVYFAYIQRDWHECWYEFACRQAGYTPFGGTILNVCRKLSAKTIAADPKSAISVQYIPRTEAVVRKAMFDLELIGQQLTVDKDFPGAIIQNRSACAGRFGNSLCPYLDVCNGIGQLEDDSLFKTAEDRYSAPEVPLSALLD